MDILLFTIITVILVALKLSIDETKANMKKELQDIKSHELSRKHEIGDIRIDINYINKWISYLCDQLTRIDNLENKIMKPHVKSKKTKKKSKGA